MRHARLLLLFVALTGCAGNGGTTAFDIPPDGSGIGTQSFALDSEAMLLQAVLQDLLTEKNSDYFDSYGAKGSKEIVLDANSSVAWPKQFRPTVPNYKLSFQHVPNGPLLDPKKPGVACIEIRKLNFDATRAVYNHGPLDGPICLGVFTIQGLKSGGSIGGCTIYYDYRKVAGKWEVVCTGCTAP